MQNADVSYRAGSRCRLLSRTWWTCKFRSMYLIRRGIHDKFSGWKIKQLSTYSKKSVHIMKFCFRLLSESTGGYCSEEIKFGAIFRIPTYPLIFQLKLSEDRQLLVHQLKSQWFYFQWFTNFSYSRHTRNPEEKNYHVYVLGLKE